MSGLNFAHYLHCRIVGHPITWYVIDPSVRGSMQAQWSDRMVCQYDEEVRNRLIFKHCPCYKHRRLTVLSALNGPYLYIYPLIDLRLTSY